MRNESPDIFSHGFRVAAFADLLGRGLQLSERELENLRRGCFLHDVGKVMMPDGILAKPQPLNEKERKTLELHAVLGDLIVSGISGLDPSIAKTVRSHHERWDGTGYPDRLRGEDIPLYARICRIADAFDHMLQEIAIHTNSREVLIEARSRLKQGCAKQFDENLVTVFLNIPDDKLGVYSG
ncbi:HD-GYP domain-containing protein [Paenibacillus pinistramenti]|uniref:HD-GYP domain-containing protein n=1 Tax=Paenibacillus pinistramenti TaxID=1768003 RepID=UPI001107E9E5|nr:HD domain-containing phosphohydrolase [Paenibacillus pinistramenti]